MQNILFDLDGTLIDPHEGITKSIQYALGRLEIPTPDDLSWCIGLPLTDSFAKLLGTSDAQTVTKAIGIYRERYAKKGLYENKVYPGIESCLSQLQSRGKSLFLATSKPKVFAKTIIEGFNLSRYFKGIYGSELDGSLSQKTDLIGYIIEQETLRKDETIMVGDRKFDLIGANGQGIRSIGITWGYGSKEEILAHNPTMVCESPDALQELISQSETS